MKKHLSFAILLIPVLVSWQSSFTKDQTSQVEIQKTTSEIISVQSSPLVSEPQEFLKKQDKAVILAKG